MPVYCALTAPSRKSSPSQTPMRHSKTAGAQSAFRVPSEMPRTPLRSRTRWPRHAPYPALPWAQRETPSSSFPAGPAGSSRSTGNASSRSAMPAVGGTASQALPGRENRFAGFFRQHARQMSRLTTLRAFSWMNFRRSSTFSPISVAKISSAATASSSFTFSSVRVSAFMVVSHN